ncbi:MAG: glycosyltransferase [Moraxella sp.]
MPNTPAPQRRPKKIGIVIPAHNEADNISACLDAIKQAIAQLSSDIAVQMVVVLDSCDDDTLSKVQNAHVDWMRCEFRCVGKARDLGVRYLIEQGADWIACTDADSIVEADWLVAQIKHLKAETAAMPTAMICGVVSVDCWDALSESTKQQYLAHYQDCMNHRHIHGANLSFASQDYLAVGGFDELTCHEDVGLVKKFEQANLPIIWSNLVRVVTSSRLDARAEEGFAHF